MTFRRIEPHDPEAQQVAAMVNETFDFYGGPFWEWKYADASGPPAVVVVAEVNSEVVGCSHYLALSYNLGDGRRVGAVVAGDVVVAPHLRRNRMATDLTLTARRIVSDKHPEAAFVAMFTWRALGAHYEKILGYTRVKPGFRQWSKRLTWDHQLEGLAIANEAMTSKYPKLVTVDHMFRLELTGSPPLELRVNGDGFRPEMITGIPGFRLRIRNSNVLLAGQSKRPMIALAIAMIRGSIRLWGSPRAIRQALSVAPAYLAAVQALKDK